MRAIIVIRTRDKKYPGALMVQFTSAQRELDERNPFVSFGLVPACMISISLPMGPAGKYAQEQSSLSPF